MEAGTVAERGRATHGSRTVGPGDVPMPECPPGAECVEPYYPEYWGSPITRSLVVGETLWTLSDTGLLGSSVADLAETGWVAWTPAR